MSLFVLCSVSSGVVVIALVGGGDVVVVKDKEE